MLYISKMSHAMEIYSCPSPPSLPSSRSLLLPTMHFHSGSALKFCPETTFSTGLQEGRNLCGLCKCLRLGDRVGRDMVCRFMRQPLPIFQWPRCTLSLMSIIFLCLREFDFNLFMWVLAVAITFENYVEHAVPHVTKRDETLTSVSTQLSACTGMSTQSLTPNHTGHATHGDHFQTPLWLPCGFCFIKLLPLPTLLLLLLSFMITASTSWMLTQVTLCSQCLYITSNPLVSLNNMYDSNHIILKTGAQRDQRTLVRSSTSWNQDSNQPHLALTVQLDLSPHQSRHTVNGQSLCEVQAAQNPLKTSSWASGKALRRSASLGLTKATHLLMMLPVDRRQRTQIRISRKSLIYYSSQKVYHDEFLIWQPGLLMTINHLISF